MSRALARVPTGVQYVFGAEARLRRAVERAALEAFAGWSYDEVVLPLFDHAALFERGLGAARAPRTYRFTDHEGDLLALRPELTTLVARTVATRLQAEPLPLRLCYSGEVFRWDPPRHGRHAEFHQVGLEHLGTPGLAADLEVILVCLEALRAAGVEGARLTLGHVGFLGGIADGLGLSGEAREALREQLDRRDQEGVTRALSGKAEPARVAELARLASLAGGREIVDDALRLVRNPMSRAAAEELGRVLDAARAAGAGDALQVDLGAVAGFDYYSGLTFQAWAPGFAAPLGGGGRYDRLMAQFGRDLPAVGFSLCLDWLASVVGRGAGASRLAARASAETIAEVDLEASVRRAVAARAAGKAVRLESPR